MITDSLDLVFPSFLRVQTQTSRISDAQLCVPCDDSFTWFYVTRAYGSSERNHKFWAVEFTFYTFHTFPWKGDLLQWHRIIRRSHSHILVKISSSHFISINRTLHFINPLFKLMFQAQLHSIVWWPFNFLKSERLEAKRFLVQGRGNKTEIWQRATLESSA